MFFVAPYMLRTLSPGLVMRPFRIIAKAVDPKAGKAKYRVLGDN